MKRTWILTAAIAFLSGQYGYAGQVPGAASDPDIPISHRDRVYSAEQFSNTVSVTDPVDNKLARRDPARRSTAGRSQPALSRPTIGARLRIFA